MSKVRLFISIVAVFATIAFPQIKVTQVEKLNIETNQKWWAPVFSPDGTKIYITNNSYNGIWEYTTSSKSMRLITEDPGSGFDFSISPDGKQIAYRTSVYFNGNPGRRQDAVVIDLDSENKSVIATGEDVSIPRFSKNNMLYSVNGELKNLAKSTSETDFLGIEYSKIVMNINGHKTILDPLKDGSYMWFNFSPDKKKYVAYDIRTGTFVADLQGKIYSRIGRRDAANWTRDGNWLIFMNDDDDGHIFTGSEICAISPNGGKIIPLTRTKNEVELYPSCSPVANEIVYCTLKGDLYLLKYKLLEK